MYYYIIILLIALFGFFLNFEFWGETGNTIFKIILFFALGYVLYKHYSQTDEQDELDLTQESSEEVEKTSQNNTAPVSLPPIIESTDKVSIADLLNDKNLSLNSFIISQFEILYNYYLPQNGYIFIAGDLNNVSLFYKKIKNNIEWNDSKSLPNIIKLLHNHNNEILIENHLTTNSTIIPYYQSEYSPGSVMGMTTNIMGDQKIYWIFDAPAQGFFNEEELKLPSQVSFTTQYVILNLFKKNSVINKLEKETIFLELSNQLNQASDISQLTSGFIDFLSRFFEAHKLTIAFLEQDNKKQAQILKTIGQTDSIKEGYKFNLEEGLCGKVIKNNQVYLLEDIEKDGYFIPRFSNSEKSNFGLRAFLAVPINSNGETIGMLSLEHKSPGAFLKAHKLLLQEYIQFYNLALSRFVK